jgi:AcrR family transcriptional regulator
MNSSSFLECRMVYRRTPAVVVRLEDNRARILKASRDLVAEDGWRHAQVAAVAAKAGLATGTVYRYFPSKAELFAEVLADVSRRERDVVTAIVDSEGSPAARLKDAVKAFTTRALRGHRLAYAMIAEPCEPEIDKARLVWRANLGEEFVRLIEMGQAQGVFRACDSRVAAACVVGAFMEALVGPLTPDAFADAEEARRLLDEIAEGCLAIVASGPTRSVRRIGRTA